MAEIMSKKIDTQSQPRSSETVERIDDCLEQLGPKNSMGSSPHTITMALRALKDYIESNGEKANFDMKKSPEMDRWFKEAKQLKADLNTPEIAKLFKSKAGKDVNEINKFLEENGFSIKLKEGQNGDLYVASVFEQKVSWGKPGSSTSIDFMDSGKIKEAVELPKGVAEMYEVNGQEIYKIKTTNGDFVYMTEMGNMKTSPMDLYQKVKKLQKGVSTTNPYPEKFTFTFPKVDFNEIRELDYLKGSKISGNIITQAKSQIKLKMDKFGAVAKAAAALSTNRSISIPNKKGINGPFLVWFEKDGVVTFSSRIGEESMEDFDEEKFNKLKQGKKDFSTNKTDNLYISFEGDTLNIYNSEKRKGSIGTVFINEEGEFMIKLEDGKDYTGKEVIKKYSN